MNLLHAIISRLPFEWAHFEFMRNALLAVIIVAPLFALIGTLVVNNRMAFFSDAIGHASLTGLGLGVLLGLADPFWALAGFSMMQLHNPVNELTRLHGMLFDEVQPLIKLMRGTHLGQEGFAQRMNAGHDVAEIMRQSHREDGQRFFPSCG